jgi:hypothetical protein
MSRIARLANAVLNGLTVALCENATHATRKACK